MLDRERFDTLVDRVESNLKNIIVMSEDREARSRALRAYEDSVELFEVLLDVVAKTTGPSDLAKRINEGLPLDV